MCKENKADPGKWLLSEMIRQAQRNTNKLKPNLEEIKNKPKRPKSTAVIFRQVSWIRRRTAPSGLFFLLSNEQRNIQSCLRKQQKELCLNLDTHSASRQISPHFYFLSSRRRVTAEPQKASLTVPVAISKVWSLSASLRLCRHVHAPKADYSRWKLLATPPLRANGDLSAGSSLLYLLSLLLFSTHKWKFRHRLLGAVVTVGGCNYLRHVISDNNEAAILQTITL